MLPAKLNAQNSPQPEILNVLINHSTFAWNYKLANIAECGIVLGFRDYRAFLREA